MEGSESEMVFNSLNFNPQLFINEVLNLVDDLVDGAFDFFHQEASTRLKVEGSDRSDDLSKGVAYIRNMIQSVLDKRLAMWEKYCLQHCFSVPEGFSLPNANEASSDSLMDIDTLGDSDLDLQLDSLRDKINLVGKETGELSKELQALERQTILNSCCTGSVNEVLQLYEQHSVPDMLKELIKTASELQAKMETVKAKRVEETDCIRREMMSTPDGDLFRVSCGKGLSNATLEELQEFMADLKKM